VKRKRQEQPERRRSLAEINLVGQKGAKAKARRRGCFSIFSLISILGTSTALLALWAGLR